MNSNKGNILIVDDTLENLQLLSNTLSTQGYKVRGAAKGQMAIRTARSFPPNLILLDIKMPEMDGYEVCEHLKADEQTRDIPVIFISALDEVIDKVRAFQVGGVDYITKPFHVEEVLARIEHQLMIQRLSTQLQEQNKQLQQEIQERHKAEQAAATANQAKSEFLANMSHELRTPLNAILGFTQLMNRNSQLTVQQREFLEIINGSGEHLLELIDDILDLSKIEAGLIDLNQKSFDFYRLLDNIEDLFQIQTEQKNLELLFFVSPNVTQYIRTDEQKLRSCLLNLLSNAIKFTNYGGVTLSVDKSDSESSLQFSVSDTGLGIAPEEIETLFDAFVQTSTGRATAGGTGLGLAITKKFVELMGGEIRVSSVFGEGTTFEFTIQLSEADLSQVTSQPRQRVIGLEPSQETYRILVVDDTKANRLLLVKLLEPLSFDVREATNGLEGVAIWESWQPHLVFMDTRMPVMSGLEATRQVRAKEKELIDCWETARYTEDSISSFNSQFRQPTIIIVLTASVFEEKRGEILAAGADDFVHKPFGEEIIFEKISQHLGVLYFYENLHQSITAPRKFNSGRKQDCFFLNKLAEMPPDWIASVYQAANILREESVLELIEQIPETSAPLATALKDLANDFRFDEIVRLTQSVMDSLNSSR
jgi:signal transduction histidine kinase